jgi:hypothetical protein
VPATPPDVPPPPPLPLPPLPPPQAAIHPTTSDRHAPRKTVSARMEARIFPPCLGLGNIFNAGWVLYVARTR